MPPLFKRYSLAIFILIAVCALMVVATMGVKSFGDKMFKDSGIEMKPRGENLLK